MTVTAPQQESTAPATLEGAFMLHQLYAVDWKAWSRASTKEQKAIRSQASKKLKALFAPAERDEAGGCFRILGHKGDLMLVFLRQTPEELLDCERVAGALDLMDFLEPTWSYLSVVELSLHGAAERHAARLEKSGLKPGTTEFEAAAEELLAQERSAMQARLYPQLPDKRYICFYPMNKRRGELKNWFMLSNRERAQMMVSHGKIGRRFAGKVTQIISSSVGLDDYDWGVDLFSDDAVAFKKLIYEMRFDEVSAVFAEFGTFVLGVRTTPGELLSEGRKAKG
ncbi:heme-dependent peroxidase [bacterium CPR1]|nr:heme-dependent peroxidase [bacterium CPR1]